MNGLELKPCPFCGGRAYLFVGDGIRVFCVQCGASSKVLRDMQTANRVAGNATKSVIEAWNRRANNDKR